MRDSVDGYGQTTVMVTHDARAAAIADRVLFLADGADRPRPAALEPARGPRGDGGAHRARDAFALKGLLGRKLRTALTAIAIVLGVAMVSGTFVLTDSIDKAFDSIFTDVRKGSNVVVTRQVGLRPRGRAAVPPRRPSTSRCCARSASSPASQAAEGSVDGERRS